MSQMQHYSLETMILSLNSKPESLGIIAKTVVDTIRQVPGVTGSKTLAGAEV